MSMTMASKRPKVLEEARPPELDDVPVSRPKPAPATPPPPPASSHNDEVPILDSLHNLAYLNVNRPDGKSQSCRNSVARGDASLPRRPTSLQSYSDATADAASRNNRTSTWRRSYHKDVEEALSSLLWEPYECRETQTAPDCDVLTNGSYWGTPNSLSSDVSSTISSSSSSSSSFNSLCDIAGSAAATLTPSFTDDFLQNCNATGAAALRYAPPKRVPLHPGRASSLSLGNNAPTMTTSFTDDFADLQHDGGSRSIGGGDGDPTMVSHPDATEPVAAGRPYASQSERPAASRGAAATSDRTASPSRAARTGIRCSAGPLECSCASRPAASCSRSASYSEIRTKCDVSSMRLSVPPSSALVPNRVLVPPSKTFVSAAGDQHHVQVTAATTTTPNGLVPSHVRSSSSGLQRGPVAVAHARSNSMQGGGGGGGGARIQVPNVLPGHARCAGSRIQVPPSGVRPLPAAMAPTTTTAAPHRVLVSGSTVIPNVHSRNSAPFTQNIIHTRVPSLPGNLTNNASIPPNNNNNIISNSTSSNNNVNVVNCYRAVPVNVVSNVPTIQCLNSAECSSNNINNNNNNNVSNVQIVQTVQSVAAPVSSSSTISPRGVPPDVETSPQRLRTFTSTEAQTDDSIVGRIGAGGPACPYQTPVLPPDLGPNLNREQRRRERRERRHQRRINNTTHQHLGGGGGGGGGGGQPQWTTPASVDAVDRLPDILNSHMPPPYSTLPLAAGPGATPAPPPPPPLVPVGPGAIVPAPLLQAGLPPNQMVQFNPAAGSFAQMPLVQGAPAPVPMVPVPTPTGGLRFLQFQNAVGMRRSRRGGQTYSSEDQPKSCCGVLLTQTVSIRWFIVMIAFVGVCCVVVGTILGAMKASGREHLTVSLLMIGVGIILVTVSGVAWRLTSHDAPTCRAMLGLGGGDDGPGGDSCTRRFVPRLPPSYGRPHHPYAAMMYPEFQYRPPPPSYQASMQEYRLRLLLLDRHAPVLSPAGVQHAVTPPPTYRSHSGSLLRAPLTNRRDPTQSEYSCPPSYRSRTSSNRPVLDPSGQTPSIAADHSREHSLSLSESNGSVVNVVSILTNQVAEDTIENISLDNVKVVPESDIAPLRMLLKTADNLDTELTKDANLVTIVQTSSDQSPVIVTVSGSQMATTANSSHHHHDVSSEMEILAHL